MFFIGSRGRSGVIFDIILGIGIGGGARGRLSVIVLSRRRGGVTIDDGAVDETVVAGGKVVCSAGGAVAFVGGCIVDDKVLVLEHATDFGGALRGRVS